MNKVLVVIDMQPCFEASKSQKVIEENIKQIRKAKSNNQHIIVIEYSDLILTHIKIKKELKNYDKVKYIKKRYDSGSAQLVKYFKKQEFWPNEINFMGVNTDACVYSTVNNFNKHILKNNKKTKIKVIREGCRCSFISCGCKFKHKKHMCAYVFDLFREKNIEVI